MAPLSGSKVPHSTSELIGTFVEAVGYGIYLMVTPQVFKVLMKKNMSRSLRIYFLLTAVILLILATVHFVVDLTRAMIAYSSRMDEPYYPETYFSNLNTGWNLTKNATYTSATIMADILLVYRTFIVWGRNYWVALGPALILLTDFGLSIWFTWSITEARPGNSVLASNVWIRSKYFLIATLALNVLCTCLISFRIWQIQSTARQFKALRGGSNVLSIIIESAAIYSAVTIVLIICSIMNASPFFIFLNSMTPLIGVVFSYIIVRSSNEDNRKYATTNGGFTSTAVDSQIQVGSASRRSTSGVQKQEGVHIHLQQIVHHDDSPLSNKSMGTNLQVGAERNSFERELHGRGDKHAATVAMS